MILLTHQTRILLGIAPANFRFGIDGFVALCQNELLLDPRDQSVFVFLASMQERLSHNDLTIAKLKKLLGIVRSSEKTRDLFPDAQKGKDTDEQAAEPASADAGKAGSADDKRTDTKDKKDKRDKRSGQKDSGKSRKPPKPKPPTTHKLVNTVDLSTSCPEWTFGPTAMMRNLAARNLI